MALKADDWNKISGGFTPPVLPNVTPQSAKRSIDKYEKQKENWQRQSTEFNKLSERADLQQKLLKNDIGEMNLLQKNQAKLQSFQMTMDSQGLTGASYGAQLINNFNQAASVATQFRESDQLSTVFSNQRLKVMDAELASELANDKMEEQKEYFDIDEKEREEDLKREQIHHMKHSGGGLFG